MFTFRYIGSKGGQVAPSDQLAVLARSKERLQLSREVGAIKAVNLDAAKRGMCDIRKKCLRSVDALALGKDDRLYFIEFKDRNFRTLCSQGRNPQKEELRIEKEQKREKRHKEKHHKQQRMATESKVKQEPTIEVELREKMFDSVLLAGLGDEQWRTVDFSNSFRKMGASDILDILSMSVFVVVFNDTTYDADATDGELKILSALEMQSQIVSCKDPQIPEAKIYWGLEKFVLEEYYTEVHTLSVPEFESYAKNRFKSVL